MFATPWSFVGTVQSTFMFATRCKFVGRDLTSGVDNLPLTRPTELLLSPASGITKSIIHLAPNSALDI